MKIICAPDSYKESLTAREAAEAMHRGIRAADADADVDLCPIGDGGEGTMEALVAATDGEVRTMEVLGPLGEPLQASWGWLPRSPQQSDTAVVEMAQASGLQQVPEDRRDPTKTTTYGTGQLIAAALDAGAQRIILCIGGSATNDGGCGCAQALGARFIDDAGFVMEDPITGGDLGRIAEIDLGSIHPRLATIRLEVASDVKNPLCGPKGAAAVYGPQKGATLDQVEQLDKGLAHVATVWQRNVRDMPGAGAAGGFGGGAVAMLGGEIRSGIELVLEAVGFDKRLEGANLVLTGEGKLDGQSLSGKAVIGVAQAAQRRGVPTVAMVGATGDDVEQTLDHGLEKYIVISEGVETKEAMRQAAALLEQATRDEVKRRRG